MRIEPGTRAIVTGASKGIGRATARALAARGARVGLVARGEDALAELAGELSGDPVVLPADVADRDSIREAVDAFVDQAGGVEVLVANAGLAHYGPFFDQPIEHAEEMVYVNVLGTIYTVSAALGHMRDRARGHIVVVSACGRSRGARSTGRRRRPTAASPRRCATSCRGQGSR